MSVSALKKEQASGQIQTGLHDVLFNSAGVDSGVCDGIVKIFTISKKVASDKFSQGYKIWYLMSINQTL